MHTFLIKNADGWGRIAVSTVSTVPSEIFLFEPLSHLRFFNHPHPWERKLQQGLIEKVFSNIAPLISKDSLFDTINALLKFHSIISVQKLFISYLEVPTLSKHPIVGEIDKHACDSLPTARLESSAFGLGRRSLKKEEKQKKQRQSVFSSTSSRKARVLQFCYTPY